MAKREWTFPLIKDYSIFMYFALNSNSLLCAESAEEALNLACPRRRFHVAIVRFSPRLPRTEPRIFLTQRGESLSFFTANNNNVYTADATPKYVPRVFAWYFDGERRAPPFVLEISRL